jgi:cytochrome P450
LADPYPFFAELRSCEGDAANAAGGGRRLFRYADVDAVLRDPRFSVARLFPSIERAYRFGATEKVQSDLVAAGRIRHEMLVYADPPQHTRLRRVVQPFFTLACVQGLRPHIEKIVADLLAAGRAAGGLDVIADFATPLPMIVIAEILGLPSEDRPRLKCWSADFTGFFGSGRPDPSKYERARLSFEEFAAYFASLMAARRRQPRDDLLSALVRAESNGDLVGRELLATCLTLLIGGHETTTGLIGNGVLALLRHPDQLVALRDRPESIPSAVEELARFDSPVQLSARVATVDVAVADRRIRAGSIVECWVGAANRDPAQFPEPDRLDLRRSPNRHLAFGHGIHYCLGAELGRLEAATAIDALVGVSPRLRLVSETIAWRPSVVFRCPKSLPVQF